MRVDDILKKVIAHNGKVVSKDTGNEYEVKEFLEKVTKVYGLSKKEQKELESHFIDYIRPQSDKSIYVENIIEKYDFQFSDGVYLVRGKVITLDDIYRLLWKEEKLLPTEVDEIIENIEKISEPLGLQEEIYKKIVARAKIGESKYLKSLDTIYPEINWRSIIYNIITPYTTPLFHIFYDDGVGGTGKSTFLEVLTKIVGEGLVFA